MRQDNRKKTALNTLTPISELSTALHQSLPASKTIKLEEEVDKAVDSFLVRKGFIPQASKRDELKQILFYNLITNREARNELSEVLNWNEVKFDIAATAKDCLSAYALVFSRYEPLGFNNLTLIDDEEENAHKNSTMISGLTYDDNDKRSVTVILKGKDRLNGTLRLISGEAGLLPAEILFNKQKGLEQIRKQQIKKGKSISEISKLALNELANPMVHYRTLVVSKSLVAKPLNIGNLISVVPNPEFDRRYKRIGFVAELTRRFCNELEEPDVICSWDQETQLTKYYENMVLKEKNAAKAQPSAPSNSTPSTVIRCIKRNSP